MNDLIYDKSDIKLWNGDTLEVLKSMPDESVDMCITSPPYYGLRIYLHKDHPDYKQQLGLENNYQDYLAKMLLIIGEIKRVLKKTGSFWLNMGDCYCGGHQGGSIYTGLSKRYNETNIPQIGEGRPAGKLKDYNEKCLLMMPERLALKMIDEQGWILRNKIKWIKQIYIHKQRRTIGSVMPTSVKDRFNESGEELYFFVKNKKYYADLDSVRLKIQAFEDRAMGIDREKGYPKSKRNRFDYKPFYEQNKFNYRVRDAKKKSAQCPQFKATKEEIAEYKQKTGKIKGGGANLNLPWDPIRGGQLYRLKKYKDNPDPRGDNKSGPGSYRLWKDNHPYQGKFAGNEDAEMFNSPRAITQRKRWKGQKEAGLPATYIGPTGEDHNLLNNPLGKNLPSCWLIGTEPHNFSKEMNCQIDHFATFPQALVEIPIKFACPPGGITLDPFCGSGTTGVVANKLGRKFWGIDLNQEYLTKICIPRLEANKQLF